jgi:diacylglycerol kinase family enzyme
MSRNGSLINRNGSNLYFVLNPRSRGYSAGFRDIAAARWPESSFFISSDEKELHGFGRQAATSRPEQTPVVVACGGDGTFRAVATAVGDIAILGIVPMGTVNIVAHQLGIPKDVQSAMELLERGKIAYIYPGYCSWPGNDVPRLFFISVSMGLDADAVHYVSPKLKARYGRIAYAVSFLARLMFRPLPKVEYILDGEKASGNGIITVSSGCYGGMNITPSNQSLHKPGIEIISLRNGSRNILGFFLALFLGIGKCTDFAAFTTGIQLEMSCPPHGRFQIDGDRQSASKIYVSSMETPLGVIANRPRNFGFRHG